MAEPKQCCGNCRSWGLPDEPGVARLCLWEPTIEVWNLLPASVDGVYPREMESDWGEDCPCHEPIETKGGAK